MGTADSGLLRKTIQPFTNVENLDSRILPFLFKMVSQSANHTIKSRKHSSVPNLATKKTPFVKHRSNMSHCLANPSFFSAQKTILKPISNFPRSKSFSVKAMANDNLQRTNTQQQQYQQPKKRTGQVAPIGLWDRFPTAKTVQQMMDTMDRIMEDEPYSYGNNRYANDNVAYSRGRTPWEIKEAETEYKMRFDMPGMTKHDVKVWVEEQMLVVKAEKIPRKTDETNVEEWTAKSYGRYSYRIALPENVEFEKIKAEVKDGVLYITIPKSSPTAKILDINVQ